MILLLVKQAILIQINRYLGQYQCKESQQNWVHQRLYTNKRYLGEIYQISSHQIKNVGER